jgi:hypothetical protein
MLPNVRFAALLGFTFGLAPLACSSPPAEGTSSGGAPTSSGSTGGGGQGSGASGGTGGTTGQGGTGGTTGQGGTGGTTGQGGTGGADTCKTALICDDFEAYAPGGAPGGAWSVSAYKGSVAVDTGRAFSGKRAVKVSADSADGYRSAMLVLKGSGLPVAGNVVFGRMMFWLESAPEATVHWTFIDGQGVVPGQNYRSLYRYGGQHPITENGTFIGSQLMANYDTPDSYQNPPKGPGSDCWLHSDKKPVPVGAWTCAEWRFDGPANQMQFWLNGAELTDLAMNGKGQGCVNQAASFEWTAPTFEQFDLGWESYQPDGARVIWIDDVALGTERLGCPAAP